MASVAKDGSGNFLVAVKVGNKRQYIRLGEGVNRGNAEKFAGFSQRLADHPSRRLDELPKDIAEWLRDLKDEYRDKLAKAGLAEVDAAAAVPTLGGFMADYIKGRTDLRASTLRGLTDAGDELSEYFGRTRDIRTITEGDAEEFYRNLTSEGRELGRGKLGPNTAKRLAGRAKQYFAHAVRKEIINRNPFAGIKCRVGGSPERLRFIPAAVIETVLEQITDPEFRAAVVLARWGGLRIPSELGGMKWGDVNFEKKRLLVRVPKLEHVEGKDTRLIPLFPEVEKALLALYSEPFGADEPVFPRLGHAAMNLRTQFERYILRAGVEAWPKLWQNLRASRATELAERYPAHVATAWMGHSQAIAEAHYWQTREAYFDDAASAPGTGKAQHVAQHLEPELTGNDRKQKNDNGENTLVLQGISGSCRKSQESSVPPVGFEPTPRLLENGF